MRRYPEPELMDSEAQTLAYAAADFEEANRLFTEKFLQRFPDLAAEGAMADLGCGPGDITLRMADFLPGWQITGLDAGRNMLKLAEARLKASEAAPRVRFRLSHLPDPGLPEHAWQAVISNSLLHHLPSPRVLWDSIARLGEPGAAVQVMDLLRPESEAAAQRLVDEYAAGEPEVLREDFYNSLRASYTTVEVSEQLLKAGLDRLKIETPSDRHWIVSGRLQS